MALKNQTQESAAPAPEQTAPVQAETVTNESPNATEVAASAETTTVEEKDQTATGTADAGSVQDETTPAPATQDAPTPEETGEQSKAVQEEQSASDVPLVLLGTRKGFPSTAAGNFNLISDVVTELYNKGVLVINVDGDESSVFFDSGKL